MTIYVSALVSEICKPLSTLIGETFASPKTRNLVPRTTYRDSVISVSSPGNEVEKL